MKLFQKLFRSPTAKALLASITIMAFFIQTLSWGAAIKTGYITRTAPIPPSGYASTTAGISGLPFTTNTAEIFFPSEPVSTIRVTSFEALGDTNTTILTFMGGTMPLTVTGIINATNLVVTANTNVPTNCVALIQISDDTIFSVTVNMTNQLTNIVIAATNPVASIATNSILWICTNVMVVPIGSNNIVGVRAAGEALFSAQRRAPVALRVTASGVNGNRIAATAKYDILP